MEIDYKQRQIDFEQVVKPVVDYLYKWGCPYSTVIITQTSAEQYEAETGAYYEPKD